MTTPIRPDVHNAPAARMAVKAVDPRGGEKDGQRPPSNGAGAFAGVLTAASQANAGTVPVGRGAEETTPIPEGYRGDGDAQASPLPQVLAVRSTVSLEPADDGRASQSIETAETHADETDTQPGPLIADQRIDFAVRAGVMPGMHATGEPFRVEAGDGPVAVRVHAGAAWAGARTGRVAQAITLEPAFAGATVAVVGVGSGTGRFTGTERIVAANPGRSPAGPITSAVIVGREPAFVASGAGDDAPGASALLPRAGTGPDAALPAPARSAPDATAASSAGLSASRFSTGSVESLKLGQSHRIIIRLEPASLGHVTVFLTRRAGELEVRLMPETAQGHAALKTDAGALTRILMAAGDMPDSVAVQLVEPDRANAGQSSPALAQSGAGGAGGHQPGAFNGQAQHMSQQASNSRRAGDDSRPEAARDGDADSDGAAGQHGTVFI